MRENTEMVYNSGREFLFLVLCELSFKNDLP